MSYPMSGGAEPCPSAVLYSSTSRMTHSRGAWVILLQVPTSMRAASARQPTIANGIIGGLHISPLLSLRVDSLAQRRFPCSPFTYTHTQLIPCIRTFRCKASVAAPFEAGTQVTDPGETEENLNMRNEAGDADRNQQAQGSTHPDEISPSFAEAMQAFEVLHSELEASRMTSAIGQAELDTLEAAIGRMEVVMSSITKHEWWYMGSACLKLAWLYSDAPDAINEPLTKVLAAGHRALGFLEALQTPVWTMVSCCYVLGLAYLKTGQFEHAICHLEKAILMIKDLEPKGPPNSEQTQLVNAVHYLLRDTRIRFGQHLCTRAREYLAGEKEPQLFISTIKEAIKLVEVYTEPGPTTTAAELENCLGFFYLQTQQANEALPHFKNALTKLTKLHGANSPKLATVHNHIGVTYTELCKLNDAVKSLETAKRILLNYTPEKGDGTEVTLYNNMAQVYALRGRFDDAIKAQRRLIELIKQNMKDNIKTPFVLEAAEETLQEMMQKAKA